MQNEILWLFNFNRERILRCIDSLTFEELFAITSISKKSPAWIVGHLTTTYNMCLSWAGKETQCPAEWNDFFSDGTNPGHVNDTIPEINKLREVFLESHDALIPVLEDVDNTLYDAHIAAGHEFPSKRVGILFECLTHDAIHLSELKLICSAISSMS